MEFHPVLLPAVLQLPLRKTGSLGIDQKLRLQPVQVKVACKKGLPAVRISTSHVQATTEDHVDAQHVPRVQSQERFIVTVWLQRRLRIKARTADPREQRVRLTA